MTRVSLWMILAALTATAGCGRDEPAAAPPTQAAPPAPWQGELERETPRPPPPKKRSIEVVHVAPPPAIVDRAALLSALRLELHRRESALLFHKNLLDHLAWCEEECIRQFDERTTTGLTVDFLNVLRRARAVQKETVDRGGRDAAAIRTQIQQLEAGGAP